MLPAKLVVDHCTSKLELHVIQASCWSLYDIIDDSNEEDIQKDTTERDEIAGGKRKLLIILRSFRLFNKHSQHTDTILGPT